MDKVTTRLSPNPNFIEIDVNGTQVTISLRNALYRAECDAVAKKNKLTVAFRAVQMAHNRGEKINCIKAVRDLSRLRSDGGMSLILAKDIVEAMWMRPE